MHIDTPPRKAMAAASIAVIFFVVAALMINTAMYIMCEVGMGCNPFSDQSMGDTVASGTESAAAIGIAHQFLLGTAVQDGQTMINASQKYGYCREGPGALDVYRCTDTPEQSDIEDAVDTYNPYPQGLVDAVSGPLPLLEGFSHEFTLSKEGEDLITAGQGGAALQSNFIFRAPIAGGQNIRMTLQVSKGDTAVGVVRE